MQACEGYVEDGRFYPLGQMTRVNGRRRAVLTILDEPAADEAQGYSRNAQAWREFIEELQTIDEPLGEEFDRIMSVRMNFSRELEL